MKYMKLMKKVFIHSGTKAQRTVGVETHVSAEDLRTSCDVPNTTHAPDKPTLV
jgi:hypothetical protein